MRIESPQMSRLQSHVTAPARRRLKDNGTILIWKWYENTLKRVFFLLYVLFKDWKKKYQLHVLDYILPYREPSVKTQVCPLSSEFWRHCELSGRIQSRALPRHQSDKNGNINKKNISFPWMGIEPTTVGLQSHPCATAARRPQF